MPGVGEHIPKRQVVRAHASRATARANLVLHTYLEGVSAFMYCGHGARESRIARRRVHAITRLLGAVVGHACSTLGIFACPTPVFGLGGPPSLFSLCSLSGQPFGNVPGEFARSCSRLFSTSSSPEYKFPHSLIAAQYYCFK